MFFFFVFPHRHYALFFRISWWEMRRKQNRLCNGDTPVAMPALLGTDNVQGQISEGIFAPSLSSAHTKEIIINSKGTKIVKDEKKLTRTTNFNDTLKKFRQNLSKCKQTTMD